MHAREHELYRILKVQIEEMCVNMNCVDSEAKLPLIGIQTLNLM